MEIQDITDKTFKVVIGVIFGLVGAFIIIMSSLAVLFSLWALIAR